MKYSKQRETILDFVKANAVHPSASHVYTMLKKEHPNLSLGTVYRNLNKLSECGFIQKIEVSDAPDRFDGNISPHYHAICVHCGQMFDCEVDQDHFISKLEIRGKDIGEVLSCEVCIRCVCRTCKNQTSS